MNPKILLAFLGGAAMASGIVYMAVKPESSPVTKTLYVEPAQPQAAQATASRPGGPCGVKSPVDSEITKPSSTEPPAAEPESRAEAPSGTTRRINRSGGAGVRPSTPPADPAAARPRPCSSNGSSAAASPLRQTRSRWQRRSVAPAPEPPKPEVPEPHSVTTHRRHIIVGTNWRDAIDTS